MIALGSGSTVKVFELEHPVVLLVNVNTTVPAAIPVTNPEFVTIATEGLLLIHVPPVVGVTVAEEPSQTPEAPPKTGKAFTVTLPVVAEQPVVASVNVNVAEPDETPVTIPALVTVA